MEDRQRRPRGLRHVFIGRDAELAELSACLEDAVAGRGRLFLIAGEPGIGKTMLAEQITSRALERGARTLWGRCWEGGGAPAYWPWIQVVRTLTEDPPQGIRVDQGANASYIGRLVPELAERFGGIVGPDPAAQPDTARFRLFDAVTVLLRRSASVQPLVIVLDDLHAADAASLLLLRFVAREIRATRLLAIATYRDTEAQRRPEVAEALAELTREGPSVRLRGLDRTEARRFMEGLTGTPAAEEAASRIYDATGGNPLFIREMVRLAGSGTARGAHAQLGIPESVRAVIHQRLASLNADAVRILSVAAVVGQDFNLPLVDEVAGLDAVQVHQAVVDAERLELVVRVSDSRTGFRFSHGLVREVLYDDLPVAARRELHARVAAAIERRYGPDLGPHLGELAYHYTEAAAAGQGARAAEYARKAGDQAMASYAYEEAAAQYRRALEALPFADLDEGPRSELRLRLAAAQARAGNYPDAKANFAQAAEVARRLRAPEQFARAALGFGEPQVEGGQVDQQLLALLREALDRLSPDDSSLRARVLARFSIELTFSDDPALRETLRDSLSQEALAMARRLGAADALGIALRARWLAAWGPDGLEERAALSEEILALARASDDRELELVGRARRLTSALEAGDIRAVEADIAAHTRLAGELRMPYHEWTAATLRAGRALLDGSFEAAEELAAAAPSLLPRRPNPSLAYLNQITPIRWEQGRLAELREAWQGIVERFPQSGFAGSWLALTSAELGREDEAKRNLSAQVEALADLPRSGLWLPALAVASLAAARLQDVDAARAVRPLLEPYAARVIVIPMPHPAMCFGSAALYLGLLATVLSRWEEAAGYFESAIRVNTRLGARAFLARTRYEYAHMLLRRGLTEDRPRVLAFLDQAEAAARAMGMIAVGRECARLREVVAAAAGTTAQAGGAVVRDALERSVFHKEGDYWTVVYEGSVVRLRDTKGLRYLSRLLASPGREFLAIHLEGSAYQPAPATSPPGGRSGAVGLDERPDLGDAGEMLDARAKAEYKARLQELQADLDEAERFNDPGRAAKLKEEIDFIVRELARAVGLGGRGRRAASHAERARLNVTRAIRAALDNIARSHPSLGRHLRSTVRTGRYCSYTPDPRAPIVWEF